MVCRVEGFLCHPGRCCLPFTQSTCAWVLSSELSPTSLLFQKTLIYWGHFFLGLFFLHQKEVSWDFGMTQFFFFFFLVFLGPHPRHMEVPRLGVESELYPLAYTTATATLDLSLFCNLHYSSWQHWILNPLSKARDKLASSQILVRFYSDEPQWELLGIPLFEE